jgi:hypothetical protein
MPLVFWNFPALQSEQIAEPLNEKLPLSQVRHVLLTMLPIVEEADPAGHLTQVSDPVLG